jgi:MYXO-CTERM domain-containing protein
MTRSTDFLTPASASIPLALVALLLSGPAFAQTYTTDVGTYSVDITKSEKMIFNFAEGFGGSLVQIGHENVIGPQNPNPVVPYYSESGSLTATFHAASGKVFDKLFLTGPSGAIFANEAGGVYSTVTWDVNGHSFTGATTSGGVINPPPRTSYATEWHITGPSTGETNYFQGDTWYSTTFQSAVAGSGYYDIGVKDFTIDFGASIIISADPGSSSWSSWITPQKMQFQVSFRDAPPTISPIPEHETYAMMLAGLGLLGLAARRRRQKAG